MSYFITSVFLFWDSNCVHVRILFSFFFCLSITAWVLFFSASSLSFPFPLSSPFSCSSFLSFFLPFDFTHFKNFCSLYLLLYFSSVCTPLICLIHYHFLLLIFFSLFLQISGNSYFMSSFLFFPWVPLLQVIFLLLRSNCLLNSSSNI